MKTRTLTVCAILAALSVGLSVLENLLPITAFIPIPGLKLGFANIAIMAAFFIVGKKTALFVGLLKVFVIFLTFGNISSFFISLTGTIFAYISLLLTCRIYNKYLSFIGISAFSAFFHAAGQVIASCVLTMSTAAFAILPPLLFFSCITGAITGFIMNKTGPALRRLCKK